MARGLVAGGIFFSVLGLLCGMLSRLGGSNLRSWLVQRSEVNDAMCSVGSGMYEVDAQWGDCGSVAPPGLGSDRRGLDNTSAALAAAAGWGPEQDVSSTSTMEAYCRSGRGGVYERDMCVRTLVGQSLALLAMLLHCGAIGAGLFCHAVNTVRDSVLPALMAMVFALLASLSSWSVVVAMMSAPLFGSEHQSAIGAALRVPYRGMGCVFQEPFASRAWPVLMLRSQPVDCLLFGWGTVLGVSEASFSLLGSCIFLILLLDLRRLRARQVRSERHEVGLTATSVSSADEIADEERRGESGTRYYSLYGAFHRHLADWHHSWCSRRFVATTVPLVIVANMSLTIAWMLSGLRFSMRVHITTSRLRTEAVAEAEAEADRWAAGLVDSAPAAAALDWLRDAVDAAATATLESASFVDAGNMSDVGYGRNSSTTVALDGLSLLEMLAQVGAVTHSFTYTVFDFNAVTSVTEFWQVGAVYVSCITMMATFLVPVGKFMIWLYLWYLPCDEGRRGRILSWVDALGKLALANVFGIAIMSVGFLFDSTLDFKLVKANIHVFMDSGFLGTSGLVLCSVVSLVVGQWFVYFHGHAARWEEIRFKRVGVLGGVVRAMDTPFLTDDLVGDVSGFEVASPFFFSPSTRVSGSGSASVLSSASSGRSAAALLQASSHERDQRDPLLLQHQHQRQQHARQQQSAPPSKKDALAQSLRSSAPFPGTSFSTAFMLSVDAALAVAIALLLVGLFVPMYHYRRLGLVGNVVVRASERNSSYSLLQLAAAFDGEGSPDTLSGLSACVTVFAAVMAALHLVGLALMWRVPLTLERRELLFRGVEMCTSWNALDLFLICAIACRVDTRFIVDKIIPTVVPNLVQAAHPYALYDVQPEFRAGFWLLLASCLLEKALSLLLLTLYAHVIAASKLAILQQSTASRFDEPDRIMAILSPTSRYVAAQPTNSGALHDVLLWTKALRSTSAPMARSESAESFSLTANR
jgi:hypothetical protein